MDLLKLIDGLRVYRTQLEEAIAAMEELARRRGLSARERKRREAKPVAGAGKPSARDRSLRPKLVQQKRGPRARGRKSG